MTEIWMDVDIALSEVPVNKIQLIDDTDFKTREESVTYNQAGMDLVWNFVATGGTYTQTAVTPTTAGDYDWANQGNGMYSIEITASGGASINNDTEGYGWFVGFATGILPWAGPIIGFRAAALNNALVDGGDVLDVNLAQILGTALTETAGLLAGGFKKFFNIATPTGTLDSLPDVVPGAAGGVFIAGSNAATSITTALTTNITGNLSGSVGSVTAAVTTDAASRTASQATGFATETKQDLMQTDMDTLVDDQTLPKAEYVVVGDTIAGVTLVGTVTNLTNAATNGDLTATMKSSVNTEVDTGLNTAIPSTPTADSINEYIQIMKYVMLNKTTITKTTGTSVILKDNDSTIYATVVGAYVEDATTVVRLRLE